MGVGYVVTYTRRQINLYRMFFADFSTDFDEIFQRPFSGHAPTPVEFSAKNNIHFKS